MTPETTPPASLPSLPLNTELTVALQIGNSDNKLSQVHWSAFVDQVRSLVRLYSTRLHFEGASVGWEPWQNAAWVFACAPAKADTLRAALIACRRDYGQDSVAWTEGGTLFL